MRKIRKKHSTSQNRASSRFEKSFFETWYWLLSKPTYAFLKSHKSCFLLHYNSLYEPCDDLIYFSFLSLTFTKKIIFNSPPTSASWWIKHSSCQIAPKMVNGATKAWNFTTASLFWLYLSFNLHDKFNLTCIR